MATDRDDISLTDVSLDAVNQTWNDCEGCETETLHEISITLKSEGGRDDGFDREPYRTTVCLTCGHDREERLNNVRADGGHAGGGADG